MQFNTLWIVHVEILLLGYRKHILILKKMNISYQLLCLEFTHKVLFFPVDHRDVALFRSQQQMLTVGCEVKRSVRPKSSKIQIKHTLCVLHPQHLLQLVLLDLKRPLPIVVFVNLDIPSFLGVEIAALLLQPCWRFVFKDVCFGEKSTHLFVRGTDRLVGVVCLWSH